MNCAMCGHEINPDVCGFVSDNDRFFCSGADHDCLSNYNQAGLYGYPDTSEESTDGEPQVLNVARRINGELPGMPPAEFTRRMAARVAELQAKFPGTKIVLGTSAPLEDTA